MKFKKSNHTHYLILPFLFLFSLVIPYSLQAQHETDESVNVQKLKTFLPDTLEGFKTVRHTIYRRHPITAAYGHYRDNSSKQYFVIKIYDISTLSPETIKKEFGWTLKPIGTRIHGKVIDYNGYKAKKGYAEGMKRGSMMVLVSDRFMVDVFGSKVKWATIEKVLQKIDLKKLEELGK